jgi:hypothetical protein
MITEDDGLKEGDIVFDLNGRFFTFLSFFEYDGRWAVKLYYIKERRNYESWSKSIYSVKSLLKERVTLMTE